MVLLDNTFIRTKIADSQKKELYVFRSGTTKLDWRCMQFADSAFKDQEGNVECYDSKSYLKLLCVI